MFLQNVRTNVEEVRIWFMLETQNDKEVQRTVIGEYGNNEFKMV